MSKLSYYNTCLYEDDIQLLEDGQWLNDKVISFMLEYFENDKYQKSSMAFISPEVTQVIKMIENTEEVNVFLEPLKLNKKELVFFVINDNNEDQTGGTHWSALVYVKAKNHFVHYDSLSTGNTFQAKRFSKKLCLFLSGDSWKDTMYKDAETSLQSNFFDCGVYAISFIEHVCKCYQQNNEVPLKIITTPQDITTRRSSMKQLIQMLINKININNKNI